MNSVFPSKTKLIIINFIVKICCEILHAGVEIKLRLGVSVSEHGKLALAFGEQKTLD
jgi:hypothetical protein